MHQHLMKSKNFISIQKYVLTKTLFLSPLDHFQKQLKHTLQNLKKRLNFVQRNMLNLISSVTYKLSQVIVEIHCVYRQQQHTLTTS